MPDRLTIAGRTLFFTADDGTNGRELWALDDVAPPLPTVLSITPLSASKAEGREEIASSFTFLVNRSGDASGVSRAAWSVAGTGGKPANGPISVVVPCQGER